MKRISDFLYKLNLEFNFLLIVSIVGMEQATYFVNKLTDLSVLRGFNRTQLLHFTTLLFENSDNLWKDLQHEFNYAKNGTKIGLGYWVKENV